MEYNNDSLSFDNVKKFLVKDDAVSPNTTPVVPKVQLGAIPFNEKEISHLNLPKEEGKALNSERIERINVNPNATGSGYEGKILSFAEVKKFMTKDDARSITTVKMTTNVIKDPNATEIPVADVKIDVAKSNTTPLNSEVLQKPDFNPNATETGNKKTDVGGRKRGKGHVDVHPEVLPVVTADIKGAEDAAKFKDEKYVSDGFGKLKADGFGTSTTMGADGFGGSTTMGADGFGGSTTLNATGGMGGGIAIKGAFKAGKNIPLYDMQGRKLAKGLIAKGATFYFYGVTATVNKLLFNKVKVGTADYLSLATDGILAGATPITDPAKPATKPATPSTTATTATNQPPSQTVVGWYKAPKAVALYDMSGKKLSTTLAKDSVFYYYAVLTNLNKINFAKIKFNNTDYQVLASDNILSNAPKTTAPASATPATSPKLIVVMAKNFYVTSKQHAGMKSMGYKAEVVIDTNQMTNVGGKKYYRITKFKGNGAWESRINKDPKMPKYWVLDGDYSQSKDQSKATMNAEGMYMDGVNGYGKPNTVVYSNGSYMHDEGEEYNFSNDESVVDPSTEYGTDYNMQEVQNQYQTENYGGGYGYDPNTDPNNYGGQTYDPNYGAQNYNYGYDQQMNYGYDPTNSGGGYTGSQVQDTYMQQMSLLNQQALLRQQLQQGGLSPQQQQVAQQQLAQVENQLQQITGQVMPPDQTGLVAPQGGASVSGNNGEFWNNGINTQPYSLMIDTYYPVKMQDGSVQHVPLPKGSIVWADAPFDYNRIAEEHKGSFPDPSDPNNQFQRYSWASVDGVTMAGGLIPMRKDSIQILNAYAPNQMYAEGTKPTPKPNTVTASTPAAIGAFTDKEAKAGTSLLPTWGLVALGLGAAAAGAYWWFKIRKAGK